MTERVRRTIPIDKALARKLAHSTAHALAGLLSMVPYEDPVTGLHESDTGIEDWAHRLRPPPRWQENESWVVRSAEVGQYVAKSVMGKPVGAVVFADLSLSPYRRSLIGGYMHDYLTGGRWKAVHVDVNILHHEAEDLRDNPSKYVATIDSILIHEMTHVLDFISERDIAIPAVGAGPQAGIEKDQIAWWRRQKHYFNAPHEVRAYMQQIVTEATRPAVVMWAQRRAQLSRTPNETLVTEVLSKSPTWDRVSRFLRPPALKKVIKTVAQALAEGGHLYERPRDVRAPLPGERRGR